MRGQRVRIFTAQQVWKADYREWKTAIDQDEKNRLRYEMEEYIDAAALERKLAAAEREIERLAESNTVLSENGRKQYRQIEYLSRTLDDLREKIMPKYEHKS